jgi:tRNA (guanine-N7-)-methyltransferase
MDSNSSLPLRKRGLLGGSGEARVEAGQRSSLQDPLYLDPVARPEDLRSLTEYLSEGVLEVEIGCGRGHFMASMMASRPSHRFLIIEARMKYTLMTLTRAHATKQTNLRLVLGDAKELLARLVAPSSVSALYLLFPDPWWKRKHERRRVATPEFLADVAQVLKPGGVFVFRTDVRDYLDLVDGLFEKDSNGLVPVPCPEGVALSHRHMKCNELGLPTWERCYRKETGV